MKIIDDLKSLTVPIDSILEDPKNTVDHSYRNIDVIVNSIKKYGQRKPIVVNKKTKIIEAGNGFFVAAKSLGAKEIAAVFVDDCEKIAKGYSIMDNRSSQFLTFNDNLADAVDMFDDIEIDIGFSTTEMDSLFDEKITESLDEKREIPEMEIMPFEHHDYIVLIFENSLDWVNALTHFGIGKVRFPAGKTKKKIGVGRVVDGAKYLQKIKNSDSDKE